MSCPALPWSLCFCPSSHSLPPNHSLSIHLLPPLVPPCRRFIRRFLRCRGQRWAVLSSSLCNCQPVCLGYQLWARDTDRRAGLTISHPLCAVLPLLSSVQPLILTLSLTVSCVCANTRSQPCLTGTLPHLHPYPYPNSDTRLTLHQTPGHPPTPGLLRQSSVTSEPGWERDLSVLCCDCIDPDSFIAVVRAPSLLPPSCTHSVARMTRHNIARQYLGIFAFLLLLLISPVCSELYSNATC
jgi:hypothetical protein